MKWQKRLRLAIALFVVVFAAVVVVSLRRGPTGADRRPRTSRSATTRPSSQTRGGRDQEHRRRARSPSRIKFGNQLTYEDGRSKFGGGVTVGPAGQERPPITIESQDAEVSRPPDKAEVGDADVHRRRQADDQRRHHRHTADRQLQRRRADDAHTRPAAVQEGTDDGQRRRRDLRSGTRTCCGCSTRPRSTSSPDKNGSGAEHVTAKTAGMARAEHYMKFPGDAPLRRRGTPHWADEATAFLTEDDERMTRMELRGNSRMTGKPGGSGPQDMRARDIDLAYAEDGRTLQSARLVENAVGAAARREGQSRDAASPARPSTSPWRPTARR